MVNQYFGIFIFRLCLRQTATFIPRQILALPWMTKGNRRSILHTMLHSHRLSVGQIEGKHTYIWAKGDYILLPSFEGLHSLLARPGGLVETLVEAIQKINNTSGRPAPIDYLAFSFCTLSGTRSKVSTWENRAWLQSTTLFIVEVVVVWYGYPLQLFSCTLQREWDSPMNDCSCSKMKHQSQNWTTLYIFYFNSICRLLT